MGSVTMETIHKDLRDLKKDIAFVKHVLSEDFKLSEEASKNLKEARETSESEYVDLE